MTETGANDEPIPLFRIDWDETELKNAVESITRGGYWANGPFVDQFEELLAAYFDVEHAVVFNSGTSALISSLDAAGVGPGDEVIVPSFTFIATANAVKAVGARPVFADIEPAYYGLDPEAVRDAITEETAAIVPVHYAGHPCRIGDLQEIAAAHDLHLIEDAAEAQGAHYEGQLVGTLGDAGVLSFCQNKIITTGEGGAVVTDDDGIAKRLRLRRSHGRASGEYFDSAETGEYVGMGYNFRMPDIAAALGVAQMERIEDIIDRRRSIAADLTERIAEVEGVHPPVEADGARHVYQLYTVAFDEAIDRDAVIEYLAERDIASKVYFDPVHLSRFYRAEHGSEPGMLPTTEAMSERVLSLPMHANLPLAHRQRIATELAAAVENCRV